MTTCQTCIHFGTLKGRAGVELGHVCLAPVTSQPPKDGVTRAKNPFVYEATAEGCCELYTPENSGVKTKPCDCKQCVKYRGFSIRSKLLGRLRHAASIFLSELREAAGPTEAISKFQKLVQQDDEKTIVQWGRHALSKESGLKLPPIYTESEWAKWCNTPCSTGA
jgi:hypothetical protein